MTGNPELKASIDSLVRELISTQGEDGYLGPFPRSRRLTGTLVWDVWGHYHIIQALLMFMKTQTTGLLLMQFVKLRI